MKLHGRQSVSYHMSPIVISVPTRLLLASETQDSIQYQISDLEIMFTKTVFKFPVLKQGSPKGIRLELVKMESYLFNRIISISGS